MSQTCTICRDPRKRDAVDAALLEGKASIRDIAGQARVSKSAIDRHRDHVPKRLMAVVTASEDLRAEAMVDKVRRLETDARRLLNRAEKEGDLRAALVGVRTALDVVGKLAEMAAEAKGAARFEALRRQAERLVSSLGLDVSPDELLRMAAEAAIDETAPRPVT